MMLYGQRVVRPPLEPPAGLGASSPTRVSLRRRRRSAAALLVQHAVQLVTVLHLDVGRSLVPPDPLPVEEEAERRGLDALARRIRGEHFFELRGLLDLEERLLPRLVADADVQRVAVPGGFLVLLVGHAGV